MKSYGVAKRVDIAVGLAVFFQRLKRNLPGPTEEGIAILDDYRFRDEAWDIALNAQSFVHWEDGNRR